MLVWKMGNLVHAAAFADPMATSRTLDRGPSAPRMMEPLTVDPSAKMAVTRWEGSVVSSLDLTLVRVFPY